ncbi:MAG TPA: DUF4238 domain-containing protein [Candidatus Dojkabacteria bacterium]|nr:DUF4238 domain-containing protein [Candidatus Dojkabacteria bacterium]
MSEKVKNHFVPKFYLKQFVNSDLISLYHIGQDAYIPDIPAEDQAQKKRLYGDNSELEDAFGELETEVAPILKNIIKKNKIPPKSSMNYFSLMNFTILQNQRTFKAIYQTDKGIEQMLKKYLEDIPDFKDIDLDKYEIRTKNAFALATGSAIPIAIESIDLEPVLIVNNTKYPFIVSDNPCIKYNLFAEHIRWHNDGRGFGTTGLQIFLPLNERLLIAFFDKKVYKTNTKGKKKTILNATKEDVINLNKLQFVCADECLYYKNRKNIKEVISQIKEAEGLRKDFIPSTQKLHGQDGYLLIHSEAQLKAMLQLSFFQIKKEYKNFSREGLSLGGLKRESFNDFYIKTFDMALRELDPKKVTMKLFEILTEKQKKYGNQ